MAVKFSKLRVELLFCTAHFGTHGDAIKRQGGRVVLDQRPESVRQLTKVRRRTQTVRLGPATAGVASAV